jgi:3-phenylpropionate/trans-cinnamate dioxygenase ferredoxin subunit
MARFAEVAKTDELKSGTTKMVTAAGREILLARIGEKYYAADNRCPHMKGDLSQGKLTGTVITCPRHGSQFDISNGQMIRWLKGGLVSKMAGALKRPSSLTVYAVKVEDGRVLVDRTVFGAVSSLRGAESIRKLELHLERGDVRAVVNGNEIPVTPFPRDIITSTITGLVSSLKGVGKIDSVKISVRTR